MAQEVAYGGYAIRGGCTPGFLNKILQGFSCLTLGVLNRIILCLYILYVRIIIDSVRPAIDCLKKYVYIYLGTHFRKMRLFALTQRGL